MYYNPETQKTASREELMVLFNASIPDSADEVNGWHLVDEEFLYPALEPNQTAVPEGIELRDGKYVRTYSVKEIHSVPHSAPVDESLEARYERLEQAFLDLAQMVSNLEDYRMLAEREKEAAENPEEAQPAE